MSGEAQQHYLEMLGVEPGATLDEVRAAYFLQVEKISDNPTEEEMEEQARLHHAYAIVKRFYQASAATERAARREPRAYGRTLVRLAAVALVIAVPVLLVMNFSSIKLGMVEYVPGTVVRMKGQTAPYGTIVRFEESHTFHTGEPTPAYQIRLARGEETVWVSERVVVNGMKPVPAFGTGGSLTTVVTVVVAAWVPPDRSWTVRVTGRAPAP